MDVRAARGRPAAFRWRRRRTSEYDVAVATWWETTYALFTLRSARYAYFVQSLEDRFFQPRALAAAHRRGPDVRPARLVHHRGALDRAHAARAPSRRELLPRAQRHRQGRTSRFPDDVGRALDGPLRIVVEGRPSVWFKGVPEALAGASRMEAPHEVTVVAADRTGLSGDAVRPRPRAADPRASWQSVYAETDVVLKLSRVEGMFGPPLEAFHRGATCVVTPVTGHDEYVVHGWNGLVVDWDDSRGTARMLDLLARDRRLLHFLRTNAVWTARGWPSWEQSSQFMAAALEGIRARPAEGTRAAGVRLTADFRTSLEANALERRARRELALAAATLSWMPSLFHALVARRWVRTLARPARPLYRRLRAKLERRALDQ